MQDRAGHVAREDAKPASKGTGEAARAFIACCERRRLHRETVLKVPCRTLQAAATDIAEYRFAEGLPEIPLELEVVGAYLASQLQRRRRVIQPSLKAVARRQNSATIRQAYDGRVGRFSFGVQLTRQKTQCARFLE